MTPHRQTIDKHNRTVTPSYRDMMRAELRGRFMDIRSICHMDFVDHIDRVRALAEMARIRQQIANLDTWASRYV